MKQIPCLAVLTSLLALGATSVQADQTNVVQEMNFQLAGLSQGATSSNRTSVIVSTDVAAIGTRQIISAIGTALGSSYSRAAKLVLVTPLGGGTPAFQIRDAGNSVDVSSFFIYEQRSGTVSSSVLTVRSGRSSSSVYSVSHLALADALGYTLGVHFDASGISLLTSSTAAGSTPVSETDLSLSGAGDLKGALVILQGAVQIRGNKLEVVPSQGGPAF